MIHFSLPQPPLVWFVCSQPRTHTELTKLFKKNLQNIALYFTVDIYSSFQSSHRSLQEWFAQSNALAVNTKAVLLLFSCTKSICSISSKISSAIKFSPNAGYNPFYQWSIIKTTNLHMGFKNCHHMWRNILIAGRFMSVKSRALC